MKAMELIDQGIFVRLLKLPHSIKGVTTPNNDNTYNVFINEELSDSARRSVLNHELNHIKLGHFCTLVAIAEIEESAG